ncbi:FUSC family protein [Bacillus sp. AGMB 02131]|uniref:FUSC family protein n=1 Tax=Peribacillus faecalis TaxID=2772559 RepID=A0A927CV48_9BACI|nr:FUSC family protein [Peribacillus faecalis]MBD3108163.1 FUSC family protein [Peribacillus faecalis]
MKKLIISKTLMFIVIVAFVAGFESIFGKVNSLVGVTIVIATLMYLEDDLTAQPWKNFFWILAINLLQGLFSYISAINMWAGIPLNFISMFIVGFFFSHNLKKPLYVAFGLQYIFMLTAPVTASELPLRLLGLASGAVIVMLSQLLLNKNKIAKEGKKHFILVCQKLTDKLERIKENDDSSDLNESIEASIKKIRKIIYDKRIKGFYLSNESRMQLKISVCLEKILLLIEQLPEKSYKSELIPQIIDELKELNNSVTTGNLQVSEFHSLYALQKKYDSTLIYKLIKNFELLYLLLHNLNTLNREELNKVETIVEIPYTYKSSYQNLINIDKNSVRFTYAIRLGIVIVIAAFIANYFALEQGKWLVYTIFSVTQPYSETTEFRVRERIIGTLIGAAIFLLLFSIITNETGRLILVVLLGYIQNYATSYRTTVITVTLCALSTAALTGDPTVLTLERILNVLIGVVIGMIANQIIMPYSVEKNTKSLVEMYKDTTIHMLKEVFEYANDPKKHTHSINNLFAVSSLIEERILLNNETLSLKGTDSFLQKQKRLNHRVYELFLHIQNSQFEYNVVKRIGKELKTLTSLSQTEYMAAKNRLKEKSMDSYEEKIITNILINIVEDCRENLLNKQKGVV